MKVAVITPTIGSDYLANCLKSVDSQTYENLVHYVFIDGQEYKDKTEKILEGASKVKTVTLQENVGKEWYGHRVYSAASFLVNADVLCYLDEDNWFEPNHIEELVNVLNRGNDWAYSLRKIYSKSGEYLCDDNCESLGKWPVYFDDKVFHVDTSSFAVRREVAVKIGHSWYGQWGADRQFFGTLKQYFPNFDCNYQHTLCYRLDGNPNSVNFDFFQKGNEQQKIKYREEYPWHNRKESFSYVGPGIRIVT